MSIIPAMVPATSGKPATVRSQRQHRAASYSGDASNREPEMVWKPAKARDHSKKIIRKNASISWNASNRRNASNSRNGINSTREGPQERWGHLHHRSLPTIRGTPSTRGYKEMSSILADQYLPRIWAHMRGEGRSCEVLAKKYSCTQEPK